MTSLAGPNRPLLYSSSRAPSSAYMNSVYPATPSAPAAPGHISIPAAVGPSTAGAAVVATATAFRAGATPFGQGRGPLQGESTSHAPFTARPWSLSSSASSSSSSPSSAASKSSSHRPVSVPDTVTTGPSASPTAASFPASASGKGIADPPLSSLDRIPQSPTTPDHRITSEESASHPARPRSRRSPSTARSAPTSPQKPTSATTASYASAPAPSAPSLGGYGHAGTASLAAGTLTPSEPSKPSVTPSGHTSWSSSTSTRPSTHPPRRTTLSQIFPGPARWKDTNKPTNVPRPCDVPLEKLAEMHKAYADAAAAPVVPEPSRVVSPSPSVNSATREPTPRPNSQVGGGGGPGQPPDDLRPLSTSPRIPPAPTSLKNLVHPENDEGPSPKRPRPTLPPLDRRFLERDPQGPRSASPLKPPTPWQTQPRPPSAGSSRSFPQTSTFSPPPSASAAPSARTTLLTPADHVRRIPVVPASATDYSFPPRATHYAGTSRIPEQSREYDHPRAAVPQRHWGPSPAHGARSVRKYSADDAWFAIRDIERDTRGWSIERLDAYRLGKEDAIKGLEEGMVGIKGQQYHRPFFVKHDIPLLGAPIPSSEPGRRVHPPARAPVPSSPHPLANLFSSPSSPSSSRAPPLPPVYGRSHSLDAGQPSYHPHLSPSAHYAVYPPPRSPHPPLQLSGPRHLQEDPYYPSIPAPSPSTVHPPSRDRRNPGPLYTTGYSASMGLAGPHPQGNLSRSTSLANLRTFDLPMIYRPTATHPRSPTAASDSGGGSSSVERDRDRERRPRQAISCFSCRKRKLRCDGIKPCMQCTRRGEDASCDYAPEVRRRGKGKRPMGEGSEGVESMSPLTEDKPLVEGDAAAEKSADRPEVSEGGGSGERPAVDIGSPIPDEVD